MQKAMTGQVIASNRRLVASCLEIGVLLVDITIQHSGELGFRTRGEMIRFSSHDIRDLDKRIGGQVWQDRANCRPACSSLSFLPRPGILVESPCHTPEIKAAIAYLRWEGTMARFSSSLP